MRALLALVPLVAAGCASSYAARGLVLRVDPSASTVTVSHEEIPGLMGAMAMRFAVRGGERLGELRPGDLIEFRLRVRSEGTRIERLRLVSAAPADAGLRVTPAAPALVKLGEAMPDFSLIDQRGAAVSLSALRGRVVAVTFIYSRCPLPDYCPRMVMNLGEVKDRFRERLGRDLVLLTVSFDPRYDTPEVLRKYAGHYGADVPGWHFLTGSEPAIARVCAAFGIEYWPDQGLITHTLQTAVIDREGRLAAAVEGKDFTGRQVADLVGTILDPGR
jgi:protein SCO1/2